MIKKYFLVIVVFFLSVFIVFADEIQIKPNQLPKNSQAFIKDTFKNVNISAAYKYKYNYTVVLNNGNKIKFALNGDWEEVELNQILPIGLLPSPVEKTIKSQYSEPVVKIEKQLGYFEIVLDNELEIKIDNSGNILKIKQD